MLRPYYRGLAVAPADAATVAGVYVLITLT